MPIGILPNIDILCQIKRVSDAVEVVPNKFVEEVQSIVAQESQSGPISRIEMYHAMEQLIDRI